MTNSSTSSCKNQYLTNLDKINGGTNPDINLENVADIGVDTMGWFLKSQVFYSVLILWYAAIINLESFTSVLEITSVLHV